MLNSGQSDMTLRTYDEAQDWQAVFHLYRACLLDVWLVEADVFHFRLTNTPTIDLSIISS